MTREVCPRAFFVYNSVMDPMSNKSKQRLARMIADKVREDFLEVHLSGNLMNTISTYHDGAGDFVVSVPALKYDLDLYRKKGVTVTLPGKGSYASEVDKSGGFSGKHKNYAERAVFSGIEEWMAKCGFEGRAFKARNRSKRNG